MNLEERIFGTSCICLQHDNGKFKILMFRTQVHSFRLFKRSEHMVRVIEVKSILKRSEGKQNFDLAGGSSYRD